MGKVSRSATLGKTLASSLADQMSAVSESIDGEKRPAKPTPEERRAALESSKLSSTLRAKLAAFRKVKGGKMVGKPEMVEVQVWLGALPADGLSKLKAMGFTLSATLTPNRLLLGAISIDKLDALLTLSFVRGVESPKFR